jgi:hypothetical protein
MQPSAPEKRIRIHESLALAGPWHYENRVIATRVQDAMKDLSTEPESMSRSATKRRLAIVTTHPVQYNAPWFRMLNEQGQIDCRVFYTWHDGQATVDPGFGRVASWDIPLTEGYPWELVAPSRRVEVRTFWNMDSPELLKRVSAFQPDAVLVIGWSYRSHLTVMKYFRLWILLSHLSASLFRRKHQSH